MLIDAVAWIAVEFDEARDTWRLLAEALCGAAEHHGDQDCEDATLKAVAPAGAWTVEDAGAL